jgi:ubiquitin-like modifier-activating enzyme ATG7
MLQAAARIWDDILSGRAEQAPSLLSRMTLLCYADLKRFHFHYWCGW